MRLTTASVSAAFAALLLADGARAQRYVAPTQETVFSSTDESLGDPPAHAIYVENRSTVPVTVFSARLSNCQNVRQSCAPHTVRIHLDPGRRELVTRVEPANPTLAFTYSFGFGWRADSAGSAALVTLASAGNSNARDQLAAIRRADSLDRLGRGPHADELTRDEFAALAGREVALRAAPDSLLLVPGERTDVRRIQLRVVDKQGAVLGRTRWLRWSIPNTGAVQFIPPDQLIARGPGRAVLRFQLAEDAQGLLQHPVDELEYPVRVAYPLDPRAPTFAGVAVDADRHTPLACADVALEDSAENVVARARTGAAGAFRLTAPRSGTYRVRVETLGWAPAYGPSELAGPDETREHELPVRFTEQLLARHVWEDPDEFRHASPAAVASGPVVAPSRGGARSPVSAAPVVSGVTLGGSESMPVLGIVGRVPAGSTWAQFVVDSAGRVDLASLLVTPGTSAASLAATQAMLPRIRFSPARDAGRPTCEMLRMRVTFGGR